MKYIIKKQVEADSISDALKKEKKIEAFEIYKEEEENDKQMGFKPI